MTALCGGGTSSPQTGVINNLVIATGAAGIFSLIPGLEWLVAVGSALGVLTYDLTTICATDPPSMPTFSTAEILAFTTGAIGSTDFNNFVQKAHDLAAIIVWQKYCKCDSGATPTAPTYPTSPPVTTVIQPSTSGCGSGQWSGLAALDNVGHTEAYNAFPHGALDGTIAQGGVTNVQIVAINPGTTSFQIRLRTVLSDINNTNGAQLVIGFYSNSGLISTVSPGSGQDYHTNDLTTTVTVPSLATFMTAFVSTNHLNSSSPKNITITVNALCGGATTSQTNTCPSDPAVLALLNQILSVLTLIQRQHVPFQYVLGAVHSGLTGAGQLTVTQLLGMKVELTTVSSVVGIETANPDEIFGAGWVSWGTPDGFEKREFLAKNPYISLPENAQILDRFGYELRPGVVGRFTEIEREA